MLGWATWVMLVWVGQWAVEGVPTGHTHAPTPNGKLLYILLDGFRWDYVDLQGPEELPGFTRFLREGVRARWTDPLVPSISFPTWTTLSTGLYAESHGIVGNYFYDAESKEIFSLFDKELTGNEKWWTAEPIWTTAEKAGLRTAQLLWSRCDVAIQGVTTSYCEPFVKITGKDIFLTNINKALNKLDEGYDFVQVYNEHTDNTGHNYGPEGEEIRQAVRDLDGILLHLMNQLDQRGRTDVNIVIVSDHGMTDTAPGRVERHALDDYLDAALVENVADKGAFVNIKVPQANVDQVVQQMSSIPGVVAYRHDDIPDDYHYRDNRNIHEVIAFANKGHFMMGSGSEKQLPPNSDFVYYGHHGYLPSVQDMKGIFFARGPAFITNGTIEPIHMVDVYQVLAHVLGVQARPHNGTWARVQPALMHAGDTTTHLDHTQGTQDHSEGTQGHSEGTHDHSEGTQDHSEGTHDHSEGTHDHSEGTHDHTEDTHDHTEDTHDHTEDSHSHPDGTHDHADDHGQTEDSHDHSDHHGHSDTTDDMTTDHTDGHDHSDHADQHDHTEDISDNAYDHGQAEGSHSGASIQVSSAWAVAAAFMLW